MFIKASKITEMLTTSAVFKNLGINWACTVLGFIAVAMIPIPFLWAILLF